MTDTSSTAVWHGGLNHFVGDHLATVSALADAARDADWSTVFTLLETSDSNLGPNMWRPGGRSWYTPLHQAAWHNAPLTVIEELVARGAWRTLRTATGETARDIAIREGHARIEAALIPEVCNRLDRDKGTLLDEHMARLIESRLRPERSVELRHPSTEILSEIPNSTLWYPVPGMYGGFTIRLMRSYLFVTNFSRMGNEFEAHVVTTEGFTLVEEGVA